MKKFRLILVISVLSLLLFLLVRLPLVQEMVGIQFVDNKEGLVTLKYILRDDSEQKSRKPFSLSPEQSDYLQHIILLEQLVGTLIKYGGTGRYENYLAEKWEVSNDGLVWDFYLRPNLMDEVGNKITSKAFIENYKRLFRIYLKDTGSLLSFDDLKGIDDFKKGGDELTGMTAVNPLQLRLIFNKRPLGLVEDLSIAQFAFYSEKDFINGKWIDSRKITSTGAYQLEEWSEAGNIYLKKRENWFSHLDKSPDKILVKCLSSKEIDNLEIKRTIVHNFYSEEFNNIQGFKQVQGAPVYLFSLILSPFKNYFKDKINRQMLRDRIYSVHQKLELPLSHGQKTQFFYPGTKNHQMKMSDDLGILNKNSDLGETLLVAGIDEKSEKKGELYKRSLLKNVFGHEDKNLVFNKIDYGDEEQRKKIMSNKFYDIRFSGVQTGGIAEPGIVRMMFCSTLGVNYPDPGGRICDLVKEYELRNQKMTLDEFGLRFNEIVYDEAAVIPLYYDGQSWQFSNDIDLGNFSPTMDTPRFDLLKMDA